MYSFIESKYLLRHTTRFPTAQFNKYPPPRIQGCQFNFVICLKVLEAKIIFKRENHFQLQAKISENQELNISQL